MTFHGTLFFQTVKFLGLRKTRLLFLLKQTSYEDKYHFLAATAGYVLSGVRRLRAPEQGDFVLWWGRVGWSTKYYSFLLEYCPHSGVIHPEKKWPAWSTKYCYFNWSTNLSPWQGVSGVKILVYFIKSSFFQVWSKYFCAVYAAREDGVLGFWA